MAMDPGRVAAGSLGPRLAGRLTAELILRSPQYMNCVKEYEIDLRGKSAQQLSGAKEGQQNLSVHSLVRSPSVWQQVGTEVFLICAGSKINSIENLGATQVSALR